MRYAKRVDSNQADVVKILRQRGFYVKLCHKMGEGWPDLFVAKDKQMSLVEIKFEGEGRFTKAQLAFYSSWQGPEIKVIHSVQEAAKFEI